MEVFSARLKWLRERKNLTQADIAEKVGMSRPGYTKIEQGQREPSLDVLVKLPRILGESLDFIVGVTDFSRNAERIHGHFIDASSSVALLKQDLDYISIDPNHQMITSKDYDPNDPESVKSKIERLKKNIPLWEQRLEIARKTLLDILNNTPCVKDKLIEEIKNDNGWLTLLEEQGELMQRDT